MYKHEPSYCEDTGVLIIFSSLYHSVILILSLLQPTVHLFRNGSKANEVIGADVQLLKNIMEKLYKWFSLHVPVYILLKYKSAGVCLRAPSIIMLVRLAFSIQIVGFI